MKIILLKDVAKVGRAYEVKEVADGYGRNLIIARGLGLAATPANLRHLEHKKVRAKAISLDIPSQTRITIIAKANDAGHLFAGIHAVDIARALKEQTNIDLPPKMITLDEPLKTTGEFVIKVENGTLHLLIECLPS